MKIKNILYLFLLTNIALMPYIFTMEESPIEEISERQQQFRKWLEERPSIYGALEILYIENFPAELRVMIIGPMKSDENGQALLNAIENKNLNEVNRLLKKRYINPNMQDKNGVTILQKAIDNVEWVENRGIRLKKAKTYPLWIDIIQRLLQTGADPDLQDKCGHNTLHWATMGDNPEIVKILLENGANPNLQDNEGNTALHIATKDNRSEIVKILLEKGANPNLQDNEGNTPFWWARAHGNREIFQILQVALENKSLNN